MAGNQKIEQLASLRKKVNATLKDQPAVATLLDELIDVLLPTADRAGLNASQVSTVRSTAVGGGKPKATPTP
jgi:hypothetical protein